MSTLIKYCYSRLMLLYLMKGWYNVSYHLFRASPNSFGDVKLSYTDSESEQKNITISLETFRKIRRIQCSEKLSLIVLIIFRDKFSKRIIDDSFDQKVIDWLSVEAESLTIKEVQEFGNLSKSELKQILNS